MLNFLNWLYINETNRIPSGVIKINLPKVEQTTSYSCGAAALRSVASYFGVVPDNEDEYIKLLHSTKKHGTTPDDLIKGAKTIGLHALGLRHMTIDSLKITLSKKIPVICAVQAWGVKSSYQKNTSGHYVVAIGFDDEKIYFEDPAVKKSRTFLTYQEFLDRWHDEDSKGNKFKQFGIAIQLTKPDNFK